MEIPTTKLPIVSDEIFQGLLASDYTMQEIMDKILVANPTVWRYINYLVDNRGQETAKACLLLYKMLETQAECDELTGLE